MYTEVYNMMILCISYCNEVSFFHTSDCSQPRQGGGGGGFGGGRPMTCYNCNEVCAVIETKACPNSSRLIHYGFVYHSSDIRTHGLALLFSCDAV